MGKESQLLTNTKAIPRHGFVGKLMFDGYAYTDEERQLRTEILTLRKTSGIDAQLLLTDESWFDPEPEHAFDIIESWITGTQYRPRTQISPEKFYIHLSDHKVNWRQLSVLERTIADFLLERTKSYPKEQLNEPIHFVYLDIMQILHRLAIASDAEYVNNQIPRISQYIHQVSSLLSNQQPSDKLFIDNCRIGLRKFSQDVILKQLDSNQLSAVLTQIQFALESLGEQYHTILHFAFVSKRVNEHPYWELFEERKNPDEQHTFPTAIGQHCLEAYTLSTEERLMFSEALPQCPELPLHAAITEKQRLAYLTSIKQLEELIHFKNILLQLQKLIEQAGEIFTITVFRQDLLALFEDIDQFFFRSHHSMLKILEDNDNLYHESILQRYSLPWWSKLISSRQQELDDYIYNQDLLTRFAINKQSLDEKYQVATELLYKITGQLRTSLITPDERILETKNLASQLIQSIYHWRLHQNQFFGLPLPEKPKMLTLGSGMMTEENAHARRSESISSNRLTTEHPKPAAAISSEGHADFHSQTCPLLPTSSTHPTSFFSQNNMNRQLCQNDQACRPQNNQFDLAGGSVLLLGAAIPGFFILILLMICLLYKRNSGETIDEIDAKPAP